MAALLFATLSQGDDKESNETGGDSKGCMRHGVIMSLISILGSALFPYFDFTLEGR